MDTASNTLRRKLVNKRYYEKTKEKLQKKAREFYHNKQSKYMYINIHLDKDDLNKTKENFIEAYHQLVNNLNSIKPIKIRLV